MELQGISKLDLKRRNRMQILKVIKESGPISRVDIASSMKITRAAVTIITNEMIEEGVLYEVGEAPVSPENLQKGRRKILIDINENYKFAIGASISDERICVGLTNLNGNIMDKSFMNVSEDMTDSEIIDFIIKSAKNILQNSCLDNSKILGMGVAVQSDMCSKMKIYFKDGKLDYSSIVHSISDALGIDVVCSNLSSSLALANQADNVKDRIGNYAMITLASHINLSILLENEIMHENVYYTNHVENMIVKPGGRKLDGYPDGSVKAELTSTEIIKRVREIFSAENTPAMWEITNGNPEKITFPVICESFQRKDEPLIEIIHDVFVSLSVLINNIGTAFFAKYVVLHGFKMNDWMFDYFRRFLTNYSGEEIAKKLKRSRVEEALEFKGGTSIIILENFYNKGGINAE